MKSLPRFVLSAGALVLVCVFLRTRDGESMHSGAVAPAPGRPASIQAPATPIEIAGPPAPPPPVEMPVLRTTSEFNAYADSPKPLAEKIAVFSRMMREAPPQ